MTRRTKIGVCVGLLVLAAVVVAFLTRRFASAEPPLSVSFVGYNDNANSPLPEIRPVFRITNQTSAAFFFWGTGPLSDQTYVYKGGT